MVISSEQSFDIWTEIGSWQDKIVERKQQNRDLFGLDFFPHFFKQKVFDECFDEC